MSWAHPLLLALAPVALIAAYWMVRRARVGDGPVFANIKRLWADRRGLSDRPVASRRRVVGGVCLAAGAAAALLALARPQWGEIAEQSFDQSREVILALDLSRSMLADDVAPSRLARAKLLISSLLDQLKGERVGLIVFSGTAFVQSPLSADYEVLRDFLDELDPSYLPEGGTDYEAMLRTAVQAFGAQGDGDRYLVVLSDGEALDEHWQTLIPALRERGIRVIGLGVGTPAGALVPDGKGGVVKDEHGAAVLSRLEPRTLQELAEQTAGTYRDAATWVDIGGLVDATVEQGKKGNYVEQRNVRLQDHYQWFLAPALLFLLLSYWLEFPVAPLARALQPRGRRPHPASAPVIAAALLGLATWSLPGQVSAAVPDNTLPSQSGTASQPNQLTATVAELSNQPSLAATDYALLATDTIAFAGQPSAPKDSSRAAVIDDALAAVDRGEAADAHAADWPALRQQLEQLKHVQEPPPQEQKNQQKQQKQQDQKGQQGQQNQQGGGGGQQQHGQDGSQQGNDKSQGSESAKSDPQGQGSDSPSSSSGSQPPKSDTSAPTERRPPGPDSDSQQSNGGRRSVGAGAGNEAKPEENPQPAGEVQRQNEVKPIDAPEAGLGAENHDKPNDDTKQDAAAAAAEQQGAAPPRPPSMRMVGGGRALSGVQPHGETALAEAVDKLDRVKDGDAPAVLFDRMNRAEGQPHAPKSGKNW